MATEIERSREPFFKPFVGPRVKVRTPLRKKSEKRQTEELIYAEKRRDYLSVHPFCEFEGCHKLACDIHHKARRGAHYLDVTTFMATCRAHHRFIHENPAEAKEMGFLV